MNAKSGSPHFLLIGAGLAGPLLAVYLAKKGYTVDVYERRADMRTTRMSAGRSINLALSVRGIHALREVGILDQIRPLLIPMRGRMIHGADGSLVFSRYGKDESEVINSVSRAELNMRLMNLAGEFPGVRFHFQERCVGMDFGTGAVQFRNEVTGTFHTAEGDTVIATDGSGSAIRTDMIREGRFNYSQTYLEHGYKELTIPAVADGGFRMERNALHIWPRKSFMLIALPNLDGSFTCTLFFPHEGDPSFASLRSGREVTRFFREVFPDACDLIPDLAGEFAANPVGSLVTITCAPWHIGGKAALLGDAAHAIVPFFGQGMNCAFEDCSVLSRCIDAHAPDWDAVYRRYQLFRKGNADAIGTLALENFIEMRDLVADPHFLLMKQVGFALEERYSDWFVPKYSMVSFHRVPYEMALTRGLIQDNILRVLCDSIEDAGQLDWQRAYDLITSELTPFREEADRHAAESLLP